MTFGDLIDEEKDISRKEGIKTGILQGRITNLLEVIDLKWEISEEYRSRIQAIQDEGEVSELLKCVMSCENKDKFLEKIN